MLNIEGLTFIGQDSIYEVYRGDTYEALQRINDVSTNSHPCGEAFARSADLFEQHLSPGHVSKIYIFVRGGRAFGALLVGRNMRSFSIRQDASLSMNAQFESGRTHSTDYVQFLQSYSRVPLYLIPDLNYTEYEDVIKFGGVVKNNELVGIFPEFVKPEFRSTVFKIPAGVTKLNYRSINLNAIPENIRPTYIYVPSSVTTIDPEAFYALQDDRNTVIFQNNEADIPENIKNNLRQRRIRMIFGNSGVGLDSDDTNQDTTVMLQNNTDKGIFANSIFFKFVGNEAYIIGTKNNSIVPRTLVIPDELEGHKVTRICKYAFNQNNSITGIQLPMTLRLIEREAFTNSKIHLYVPRSLLNKVKVQSLAFNNTRELNNKYLSDFVNLTDIITVIPDPIRETEDQQNEENREGE